MQVKLNELKRKKVCPILHRHEWDYKEQDPRSDFFRFCITEMMRWQYRKGRGISYDILASLVSRLAIERKIERLEISEVQMALKGFTSSGLYFKIKELIANLEIQVGISRGHVITHTLPALCEINNQTCIVTWDNNIRSMEDMKQSYETRLAAVWSFYSLNRYPVFYNIYLDDKKVKRIRYKPNQFYIRDSKTFLLNMKDLIEDKGLYPAPREICENCNRRAECRTVKTKTMSWQKSW